MREYVIICGIGLAACSGGSAKRAALPSDTAVVPGPPAVAPASSATDSVGIRPPTQPPRANAEAKSAVPALGVATVGDTVRGIVSVVGTDRDHHVTIARAGGGKRIEVTGPLAALVGHLGGADVWVSGAMSGTTLAANRFIVRTVDGVSAIDGTLKTEESILYIIAADGSRTRITSPPPALVGRDGARVWITGDPARGVEAYGFIDPPR